MIKQRHHERGIYLVIVAIILIALISLSALALDMGRLLVLKNEMQNAVDAATLAASRELDGSTDARAHARKAAREILKHSSHFGRDSVLLSAEALPDTSFVFYCRISTTDSFANNCSDNSDIPGGPDKKVATTDAEATYVEITMDPFADANAKDHFSIDLFFLPVLNIIIADAVADEASLKASALAGPSDVICNFPPLAVCDPFENDDGSGPLFRDSMPAGGHMMIKLKKGSNQWTKGNYGLLAVRDESGSFSAGANAIGEYLADPDFVGCQGAVQTAPGQKLNKVNDAIETRFGDYSAPFTLNPPGGASDVEAWPPDVNINEYVIDDGSGGEALAEDAGQPSGVSDDRFGDADWPLQEYWDKKVTDLGYPALPDALWIDKGAGIPVSRYSVYQYELDPVNGIPYEEYATPTDAEADRRILNVAVLRCATLGLNAGKETAIIDDDVYGGFAEIFILAKPRGGGGPDPDETLIATEFIRMGSEDIYSRDFILYE